MLSILTEKESSLLTDIMIEKIEKLELLNTLEPTKERKEELALLKSLLIKLC